MAISRLSFALGDLIREIRAVAPQGGDRPDFSVEIRLDQATLDAVERELVHHHGAQLQKADVRPLERGVKYAGMRLVADLPGNRR